MRLTPFALTAASLFLMTGCCNVISLDPLAPDSLMIQNSALPGVWEDKNDEIYIVRATGDTYEITYYAKDNPPLKFNAKLFRIGDAEVLDLTPDDNPLFGIAGHTPVRLWVDSATMRFTFLDSKWLRERAAKELATRPGDRMLLMSSTEEIARFLGKYGSDERAFQETPNMLHRK